MREKIKIWIIKNTMRISILLASVVLFVVVNNVVTERKEKKKAEYDWMYEDNIVIKSRGGKIDTIKMDSIKWDGQ